MKPTWVATRLAAAGLLFMLSGCGAKEQQGADAPGAQPINVTVMQAAVERVPVTRTVIGTIEPYRKASLGTKILGRVEQVDVNEGDVVKSNALLVRVDAADVAARRVQAEAGIAEAEAASKNASTQFERIKALRGRDSATQKELDDAEAALSAATARVNAARSMRQEAEILREYGEVRAPFAGVVTSKLTEKGDMAAPGVPLLVLEDLSKVKVSVRIPEMDIGRITPNMKLAFMVQASTPPERSGYVEQILPSADPGSRTFEIKILIDSADSGLRPGTLAEVEIPVGDRDAIVIPRSALYRRGQLEGVFVVVSDKANLNWIKTGRAVNDSVEVLSGLEPGDRVVVSSEAPLRDGAPVRAGRGEVAR